MTEVEAIDEVYDKLIELKDNTEQLENDNKNHESKLINNRKNIEEANLEIEKIMKDLIQKGGIKKEEIDELNMLFKLIDNASGEFSNHKTKMEKCLNLLITFSNQFLEAYKTSEEDNSEEVKEEKLNELLQMSKEDLVDICKDNDLSHTGSKKKLAERIIEIYDFNL